MLASNLLLHYLSLSHIPTVSPAKNYLACFSSIGCIDHQIWKGHREEAKNGPPWEHRMTRNEGAMVRCSSHVRPQGWLPSLRGADVVNPLGAAVVTCRIAPARTRRAERVVQGN